jgi:hypothetical protein
MTDNNATTTIATGNSNNNASSSSPYRRRARVLLVGSGRMGQIRAKAVYANPRFELIGVVDSNVDAAEKLAEMYHVSSHGMIQIFSSSISIALFSF